MTNVSSHGFLVLRAAGSQSAQVLADWGKSTLAFPSISLPAVAPSLAQQGWRS